MGLTDVAFTPSEYILLNGEKFAPEVNTENKLQLLSSDKVVDGPQLAAVIIAAAILANEEEGALIIETKQKKRLLGKSTQSDVYLRTINQPPNWSGYTLEAAVLFVAGQHFTAIGQNTVRNVIYTILTENRKDSWQKIIELVEWGLASSNFLLPVEGVAAAAFSTPFICPDKVRDLALAQPMEPVRDLLVRCKQSRPEIWKLMMTEIHQAFKDRAA